MWVTRLFGVLAYGVCALAAASAPRAEPLPPVGVGELWRDTSLPLRAIATAAPSVAPVPGTGGGELLGPVESFEGISNEENGGDRAAVPDAQGDVGPRHYVQWVNRALAVYSKTGSRLLGPIPGSEVWRDFALGVEGEAGAAARLCETTNRGDPVVVYDQLADRWVLTQFAWQGSRNAHRPPYVQCLAVSTTSDPTQRYYRYAFRTPNDLFNDYSKLGLWPGAYVLTYVAFDGYALAGASVVALDRDRMLAGLPLRAVHSLVADGKPLLPADFDGPPLPPGSARALGPPLVVGLRDGDRDDDALELWRFDVDFARPELSRFLGPVRRRVLAPFTTSPCNPDPYCVRQPGGPALNTLADRLMFRAEYRRLADYDAMAVTHTIVAGSQRVGLRWYELRGSGGGLTIAREGTYAPPDDDRDRWVPSVAIDRLGNVGLAFSVTGADLAPSIGYVGFPAPDAVEARAEAHLAIGGGIQEALVGDWGDYASITVDPVDGCSFWLTQQYYPASGEATWHTRIGSFRFASCGAVPGIRGTAREGMTLTASPGSWPELTQPSFEYRWRRCDARGGSCVHVSGPGDSYTLGADDVDATIRVAVTASGPEGTASSLSEPTDIVTPVPATAPVDLTVTVAASNQRPALGERVVFTVSVANGGTGTATGVRAGLALPPTFDLGDPGDAVASRGPGCGQTGRTVVCDLDFLPARRTAEVTVPGFAARRGRGTAIASVAAAQPDPRPTTNSAGTAVAITAKPTLVSLSPTPVTARLRPDGSVVAVARLSIDEPARVTLSARGPRGRALPLLRGSAIGRLSLRARAQSLTARRARSGEVLVRARLGSRRVRPGRGYRLVVSATDADGLTTNLRISFVRRRLG